MTYTDTFRVKYDDEMQMVRLFIKQNDHVVLAVNLTYLGWEDFINTYRDENTKYISMEVPISDHATQYIRVPSKDFRLMVAEYELKKNSAGN